MNSAALAFALCLPAAATCQVESSAGVQAAVCIHRSPTYGTYLLTAKHGAGSPWTLRTGGRAYAGTWCVVAADCDIALLWHRDASIPLAVTPLGNSSVMLNSSLVSIGYDQPEGGGWSAYGGRRQRAWSATCHGWEADHDSGPGRSGGGLFNAHGELVGVCSYRSPLGRTGFVGRERIEAFLGRAREKGSRLFGGSKKPAEFPGRAACYSGFRFACRAKAAFLALADRCSAVIFAAPDLAAAA